mmetsp:Transcript_9307/g.12855  ORF Transcript_9307/g.12855 Transcript_9307/m.12855 type:complete len:510 (+) Transcript_9307:730-2259(+)
MLVRGERRPLASGGLDPSGPIGRLFGVVLVVVGVQREDAVVGVEEGLRGLLAGGERHPVCVGAAHSDCSCKRGLVKVARTVFARRETGLHHAAVACRGGLPDLVEEAARHAGLALGVADGRLAVEGHPQEQELVGQRVPHQLRVPLGHQQRQTHVAGAVVQGVIGNEIRSQCVFARKKHGPGPAGDSIAGEIEAARYARRVRTAGRQVLPGRQRGVAADAGGQRPGDLRPDTQNLDDHCLAGRRVVAGRVQGQRPEHHRKSLAAGTEQRAQRRTVLRSKQTLQRRVQQLGVELGLGQALAELHGRGVAPDDGRGRRGNQQVHALLGGSEVGGVQGRKGHAHLVAPRTQHRAGRGLVEVVARNHLALTERQGTQVLGLAQRHPEGQAADAAPQQRGHCPLYIQRHLALHRLEVAARIHPNGQRMKPGPQSGARGRGVDELARPAAAIQLWTPGVQLLASQRHPEHDVGGSRPVHRGHGSLDQHVHHLVVGEVALLVVGPRNERDAAQTSV